MTTPARINLAGAQDVSPPASPTVETIAEVPATNAGLNLAQIFASILAAYLLISAVTSTIAHQQWLSKLGDLTAGTDLTKTNSATKESVETILSPISAAYERSQTAMYDFHKTVIVNVLFPILTALLGYLFASRGGTRRADSPP